MTRRPDQRSQQAEAYQWVYTSKRWRDLRWRIFVRDVGICAMCKTLISGKFHVDHIKAHKGDENLIWDETNLQLLHPACHNSAKQRQEKKGFVQGCDASGRPLDKSHVWNQK
ncbi:MAG: HNH endonuclease [Bdellovibrionales bacterium]|nr:HNH endonuclease [Bdellovibrionales bacterium]